jgi:hypothetical protein
MKQLVEVEVSSLIFLCHSHIPESDMVTKPGPDTSGARISAAMALTANRSRKRVREFKRVGLENFSDETNWSGRRRPEQPPRRN